MGKVLWGEYIKDTEETTPERSPPKYFTISTKKHADGEIPHGEH